MELTEVNALNMTLRGSRVCEEKGRRGRGERRRRSLIDFKGQIRSPRIIGIQCDNLSPLPVQFSILLEPRVGGGRVLLQRQTREMSLGTSFIAWCSFKSALCGRSGFMSGSIHSTQHGTLPKSAPSSFSVSAPFRSLIRLSIARAPTTTR